jgi:magnesium transporter
MSSEVLSTTELRDAWPLLSGEDRVEGFGMLARAAAEDLFLSLDSHDQADLLTHLPTAERRSWIRLLPPDDAADLIQQVDPEQREALLALLDDATRSDVRALLAYEEDEAGGLMNPRYARLRPDMSADEAIKYLRRQTRESIEVIYYAYVLDPHQRLLGVVSFRDLMTAPPEKRVRDVMRTEVIAVPDEMDQEAVSNLFAQHGLIALPVVDAEGRMKGIVTSDDIVAVVKEEATEDIQKVGGMEALDAPYWQVGLLEMTRKRGIWLTVLFLGETLTATAMAYYEHELAQALVLALFVPLIISSGGNAGSQATTLIIRAMALGEVRLRDWWRVMRREMATGLALGAMLGVIGVLRVEVWEQIYRRLTNQPLYGEHSLMVALTVGIAVVGVVLWGTTVGSMLPFILRRLGLDPASASAPFVATLVDVTGLAIYFSAASFLLRGTML